jgi:hypothetical protein
LVLWYFVTQGSMTFIIVVIKRHLINSCFFNLSTSTTEILHILQNCNCTSTAVQPNFFFVKKKFKYLICLLLLLLILYNERIQRIVLQFLVRFKSKTFISKEYLNVNIPNISLNHLIRMTVSKYYLILESIGIC